MIRRAFLLAPAILALSTDWACSAPEYTTPDRLARAVLNEAEGEPYSSKLAHAFLFVNRGRAGMSIGSSGLDSSKVRARLARASVQNWADARQAVSRALSNSVPDPTRGAIYCENTKAFGVPAYIRRALANGSVEQSAKVGDVVFWRNKK